MKVMRHAMGSILFAGTIVGAGILGLPFALGQSGFLGGSLLLLLGGFFAYLTAVYIAMLLYEQGDFTPLHSLADKYLGRNASFLTLASIMFTSYGALVAYPLAIGEIFSSLFGFPLWLGPVLFIVLMALLTSQELGSSNKINTIIAGSLFLILIWVMLKSISFINSDNLTYFRPSYIAAGWGIIIFAFNGHMVIPSVLEYIDSSERHAIKVLLWGIIGVGILYFLFFLVSIGIMGREITTVATIGLAEYLSRGLAIAGQLFAILAIITSFFGITISLRHTYERQFHMTTYISMAVVLIPVILLDLLLSTGGGQAFVEVLNLAGGIGSSIFSGLIPALIVLRLIHYRPFPFGKIGVYSALIFYSLAIIYTAFL